MSNIVKAIRTIRPNSEFVIRGTEIEWHVLEGDEPTKAEIDKAIKDLEAAELVETENKALAKTALFNRLGITAEEAILLLS
jgi:arsenate reductase-like glutaredoxin family protein